MIIDATTVSLLDSSVKTLISGFGSNLVPTVMDLIGILVPVGLTLWAIGFGVKKGIRFLQANASKSI